jgi:hypothetical protein
MMLIALAKCIQADEDIVRRYARDIGVEKIINLQRELASTLMIRTGAPP